MNNYSGKKIRIKISQQWLGPLMATRPRIDVFGWKLCLQLLAPPLAVTFLLLTIVEFLSRDAIYKEYALRIGKYIRFQYVSGRLHQKRQHLHGGRVTVAHCYGGHNRP